MLRTINQKFIWEDPFAGKNLLPIDGRVVFFIGFFLVGIKNSFSDLIYPRLFDEDGANIFSLYFNEHSFGNILEFYNGYIQLFPSLVGYLIHFLPVSVLPYGYSLVAMVFATFAYFLLYRVVLRISGKPDFALFVFAVIAFLPLGGFEFISVLMYQIWNGLLVLFALLFLPLPKQLLWRAGYALGVLILIASHPLSLLFAPVYGYRWVKNRPDRLEYGLFVFGAVLYYVLGVKSSGLSISGLQFFPEILSDRVIVDALVGPGHRPYLQYLGVSWMLAGVLCVFLATCFYRFRGKMSFEQKEFLVLCVGLLVASLAASLAARPHFPWQTYYHLGGGMRYVYISKIMFLLLCLMAFFYGFRSSQGMKHGMVAIIVVFFWIHSKSNLYYQSDESASFRVMQYVQWLSVLNHDCSPEEKKVLYLNSRGQTISWVPGDRLIHAEVCPAS